jgi:hypothetical protein
MTLLDVEVTAEDIAEGERFTCDNCPIARALRRAARIGVGGWPTVAVGCREVYLNGKPSTLVPAAAREFIYRFDNGDPVKPIAFQLTFEGEV